MSLLFPLTGPGGLIPLQGDLATLLSNVTAIRIANIPTLADLPAARSAARIGVDNITAAAIPEPSTVVLLATGALALMGLRRRAARRG